MNGCRAFASLDFVPSAHDRMAITVTGWHSAKAPEDWTHCRMLVHGPELVSTRKLADYERLPIWKLAIQQVWRPALRGQPPGEVRSLVGREEIERNLPPDGASDGFESC